MTTKLLNDQIEDYLVARKAQGFATATIRNDRQTLTRLMETIGNIQVGNIDDRHIETFVSAMEAKGHGPGTMNMHLAVLRKFWVHLRRRKMIPQTHDPITAQRWRKVVPANRLRIPASQFEHLLASARHPRDRAVIAAGLYLFLRQGEMASLRIRDLSLDKGEMNVVVHKTKQRDIMPVCYELDMEMRRWLTWYGQAIGHAPLPDDYLFPAKDRPIRFGREDRDFMQEHPEEERLRPTSPISKPEDIVNRVLVAAGHPITTPDGESSREGMHTLRRSGARARFDYLVQQGYDGALRHVQSMLHHAHGTMTERYLGLDLDVARRNELLKGQPMFATEKTSSNVTSLRERLG